MEPRKNPRLDLQGRRAMLFNFGLCISLLLVISAFEWETPVDDNNRISPKHLDDYTNFDQIIPERKIEKLQPPKPKDISKVEAAQPEELQEPEKPEFNEPIVDDIKSLGPVIELNNPPLEVLPEYFIVVETMPVPEGGMNAFYKFVEKHMKYPRKAVNAGVEGIVYIKFIVDEKGEATRFEILRGIGFECDEEALRVLKMYKWQPGKQRGHPVKVMMTMPIHFRLN